MHWPLTAVFPSRGGGTAFRAPFLLTYALQPAHTCPEFLLRLGGIPPVAWLGGIRNSVFATPHLCGVQQELPLKGGVLSGQVPLLQHPPDCVDRRVPIRRRPQNAQILPAQQSVRLPVEKCAVKRFNLHIRERYAARALLRGSPRPEPRISAGRTSDPALSADKRSP